jgi:hypothetical protein
VGVGVLQDAIGHLAKRDVGREAGGRLIRYLLAVDDACDKEQALLTVLRLALRETYLLAGLNECRRLRSGDGGGEEEKEKEHGDFTSQRWYLFRVSVAYNVLTCRP